MKSTYILSFFFFLTTILCAQPRFVPDTEIVKLGEVEFQHPKMVKVGFTNKGDRPLLIKSVHPSCGCMDVTFPKEKIEPREQGEITLTYDAKLLGAFHKDVEIFTNASEDPTYIYINGVVVTEIKDYSKDYPIDLGNIRLKSNYIEFDDVNKGDHPVAELELINVDRVAYQPELMHLPPYLSMECVPENIPPGKSGIIKLTLNSEKLNLMGLNQTSVYLARYIGDKIGEANEIVVSAVLLPDFSQLKESDLANAPELYITEKKVNIGSLGGKEKRSAKVMLINMGKSDLHFQQVQVFSKSISVSLGNRVLKPGKSTKLKVTAHSKYLKNAKNTPRVLLITNDPKHAKEIINVDVKL